MSARALPSAEIAPSVRLTRARPAAVGARRSDDVTSRLRSQILDGTLRVGARLPAERELAARLHTNRTTLREALRILEGERLLRIHQGEDTLVLDWRRGAELNLLPAWLASPTSPASPAIERVRAIRDLQALRTVLLVDAAGQAAVEATPADLGALRAALVRVEPGAGLSPMENELALFAELLAATHSVVSTWVFNTFARTFAALAHGFPSVWVITPQHRARLGELVELIATHRPVAARASLRQLLHRADRIAEQRIAEVAVELGLLSHAEARRLLGDRDGAATRAASAARAARREPARLEPAGRASGRSARGGA